MSFSAVRLATLFAAVHILAAQSQTDELAQKAVEAQRQGDFRAAIAAYRELIRTGADAPELRSNLGIAYYQAGDAASALHELQIALSQKPRFIPAELFAGLSLLKLGRPREAASYLEKAHAAQPSDLEILLALARSEVAENDLVRAAALYGEAAHLAPQNSEAWYGLGVADRALAQRALKTSPANAKKLLSAADDAFSKAMQLDPGSVRTHMILGESLRIAERYREAIQEYKAAVKEQPELAAAWAGLAAANGASGDDANAIEAANRAIALDRNDADSQVLLAALYMRQADYAKAEPYAKRAAEIQPDLASAHLILGKILVAKKQPENALRELKLAVAENPDASTYYLLATVLRQLGRTHEASAALEKYKLLHGK